MVAANTGPFLWQKFTDLYAEDEQAFFRDYAEAHKRLSELGAKFDPPEVCLSSATSCGELTEVFCFTLEQTARLRNVCKAGQMCNGLIECVMVFFHRGRKGCS
jgi:hypothetical protein